MYLTSFVKSLKFIRDNKKKSIALALLDLLFLFCLFLFFSYGFNNLFMNYDSLMALQNQLSTFADPTAIDSSSADINNILNLMMNSVNKLITNLVFFVLSLFLLIFIFSGYLWKLTVSFFENKKFSFKFSFKYFLLYLVWYIIFLISFLIIFYIVTITNTIIVGFLFLLLLFVFYLANLSIVNFLSNNSFKKSLLLPIRKILYSYFFILLVIFISSLVLYLLNSISPILASYLSFILFLIEITTFRFFIVSIARKR